MAAFIADASAIAALLLEELSDAQGSWVAHLANEGALAPAHMPVEVASALLSAVRNGRIGERLLVRRFTEAAQLPIQTDEPPDWAALERISMLGANYKLSVYDAIYLDLALRTGLPLASYDKALSEAARRNGIAILV